MHPAPTRTSPSAPPEPPAAARRPGPRATAPSPPAAHAATPATEQAATPDVEQIPPSEPVPATAQGAAAPQRVRPSPRAGAAPTGPLVAPAAQPEDHAAGELAARPAGPRHAAPSAELRSVRARIAERLRRSEDDDDSPFFPPEVEARPLSIAGAGSPVDASFDEPAGSQQAAPRPHPRPVLARPGVAPDALPVAAAAWADAATVADRHTASANSGPAATAAGTGVTSTGATGTRVTSTGATGTGVTGADAEDDRSPSWWSRLRGTRAWRSGSRFGVIAAIAVGAAIVLRLFVIAPYFIPSQSMEPTLHGCTGCNDDHIVIDKISYRLHAPRTGDIVVFNRPKGSDIPEKTLVKRVIGIAGDRVSLRDGLVYINGGRLNEPYLNKACGPRPSVPLTGRSQWTVPKDDVFVMGDNRCNSTDSRVFGPITDSSIQGRAFAIIWPFSRITSL